MTQDMKTAIVLFCLSLLLLFVITPNFVETPQISVISPRFFPNLATVILGVASLLLFFKDLKKTAPKEKEKEKGTGTKKTTPDLAPSLSRFRPLMIGGILWGYFLLFEKIGFTWATPVAMMLMMVVLGQRNIKIIVGTSIVLTFLLLQLFQKGLGLPLY